MQYKPSSDDVRLYEVCLVYPHPMPQKEESEMLKAIDEIFSEADAKLIFRDPWGRRGLAFPVNGSRDGTYLILYYELSPEKLKDIDRQLKIVKGVLKYLIVKPPKNYEIVSYAERFVSWQEERRNKGERDRSAQEEKLKQQVLEKARKTSTKPERKAAPAAAKPMEAGALDAELKKLTSDSDLSL
jgi:small subunit ribosomal protein S6